MKSGFQTTIQTLQETWKKNFENKTPFLIKIESESPQTLEILEGNNIELVSSVTEIEKQCLKSETQCFLLPYSAINIGNGIAIEDELYPTFFTVSNHRYLDINDYDRSEAAMLSRVANANLRVFPDISDTEYGSLIEYARDTLIKSGEGCNFVFRRDHEVKLSQADEPEEIALGCFMSLLSQKEVSYWNFAWFDGERFCISSTPESLITISDGIAKMNPISGTYRCEDDDRSITEFLNDKKEIFELDMVLDEELKVMSRICHSNISVEGPELIKSNGVIHTGFSINGSLSESIGTALMATLGAPTVVGSPLSIAQKYVASSEKSSRGYYAGTCGVIYSENDKLPVLKSALIIRCLELDKNSSKGTISAGATIVKDSDITSELSEVWSKTKSTMKAMGIPYQDNQIVNECLNEVAHNSNLINRYLSSESVKKILRKRRERIPSIWRNKETACTKYKRIAANNRIILIECGDNFIWMIAYILKIGGYETTVINWDSDKSSLQGYDCIILGPGPGDPRIDDERAKAIREWERNARESRIATIAVCLSHQILSKALGYSLELLPDGPSQGKQKKFELCDGNQYKFACYNSYHVINNYPYKALNYIKGVGYRSFQFHPESVLSQEGDTFLVKEVKESIQEITSKKEPDKTLRITLWFVSENELSELYEKTQMHMKLWGFTQGLVSKTWIVSQNKHYWGAITSLSNRDSIDYSLKINIGKQVTGREPDFDQNFDILQGINSEGIYEY
ncbi:chorismate-binding protein [Microbacterium foliorum]|uniref:chorismate-binding protein n=1 Tax=Rothia terrae TaxID=396015 RepID=UPI0034401452